MQPPDLPPATVSQQALRELCQPRPALTRPADDAVLGARLLKDPRSVRLLVYTNPKFGQPPVVVELPRECFETDEKGRPLGLRGPIARVAEPDLQTSEVLPSGRQIRALNPWHGVRAKPDANGDFLYDDEPRLTPDTYVASSDPWSSRPQATVGGQTTVFYLAHRILALAQRWAGRPISLAEGPLTLAPHERLANAKYEMFPPKLAMGVLFAEPAQSRQLIELAKSRRSVVHELGHGLMFAVHPYAAETPGSEYLGEAFADLTDLFDLLDEPRLRQQLIDETGGNIQKSSSFSRIFEVAKQAVDHNADSFRDLANDLKVSAVDFRDADKTHKPSTVVSGAVLSILAAMYETHLAAGLSPNEALRLAYEHMARRWMAAVEILPNHFIEPADVGRALIAVERQQGGAYLEPIRRELLRRELLTPSALEESQPSLARAFAEEGQGAKLTAAQAERFIAEHAHELGVAAPLTLKVDEIATTMTGGQLIRFQVFEQDGDRTSRLRNRATLVADNAGRLVFQHGPFAAGVTSAAVASRLAELRADARKRGSDHYDTVQWILAGPQRDGVVAVYVLP